MFRFVTILELLFFIGSGHSLRVSAFCAGPVLARTADSSPTAGETPNELLHTAVRRSQVEEIKRLIASGADVNALDSLGTAPLQEAVLTGSAAITSLLLKDGANANARQPQTGATALEYAVSSGRPELVKILVGSGARLDLMYSNGQTVLHLAAKHGPGPIAAALLAARADVDALDANGNTPLDEAVLHGNHQVVSLLLRYRADAKRVHPADGRGPIHEICVKGFADLVPVLVAAGADPALQDRSGQTPLDLALDYKNAGVVQALLRLAPQNRELKNSFPKAMGRAAARGRIEIVRMLIDAGFDINQRTPAGSTYLNDAALKGQSKTVRLLLDRGARLDGRNQTGGTPLHDAALGGNTEVIQLLLDRGCAIDARDRDRGATPLMLAASLGQTAAVGLLLKRGANPRLRDNAGRTALDRAEEGQYTALVELLKSAVSLSGTSVHTT